MSAGHSWLSWNVELLSSESGFCSGLGMAWDLDIVCCSEGHFTEVTALPYPPDPRTAICPQIEESGQRPGWQLLIERHPLVAVYGNTRQPMVKDWVEMEGVTQKTGTALQERSRKGKASLSVTRTLSRGQTTSLAFSMTPASCRTSLNVPCIVWGWIFSYQEGGRDVA